VRQQGYRFSLDTIPAESGLEDPTKVVASI